jgi:hypothetical protein
MLGPAERHVCSAIVCTGSEHLSIVLQLARVKNKAFQLSSLMGAEQARRPCEAAHAGRARDGVSRVQQPGSVLHNHIYSVLMFLPMDVSRVAGTAARPDRAGPACAGLPTM